MLFSLNWLDRIKLGALTIYFFIYDVSEYMNCFILVVCILVTFEEQLLITFTKFQLYT